MSEEQQQSQLRPRRVRPTSQVQEQALHSYKSYWPFVLAVALIVLLLGVMTHPIVLGIGIVFTVVAIIGWGFEHRK